MQNSADILVVDDDAGMLRTLHYILSEKGYQVDTATDGAGAIAYLKAKHFNVLLTDIKMPGMNGVELMRETKRLSPDTVIVMMTAYTRDELVQEAMREGAMAVLPKPLDLDQVVSFIEGSHNQKSILILDDDRDFCVSLQGKLMEKGYRTIFTTELDEALDIISEHDNYIVFLDMKLDGITGYDALIAIKEINPGIIVVLITDHQQEMRGLIKESLSKTAYTCLYKPLDVDALLSLLRDIEQKELVHTLGEN